MWNMSEKAKQYIENCKRMGKQERRDPEKERDALYERQGCQIYLDDKDAAAHEGVIKQTANRKVEQQKQLMCDGFNPVSPKIPQAEEQKNCPYCHSHDIHGTKEFKCNYDMACAWIELDDKVITFDNADGGRTFGEFEINYCPICGRKLED